MASAFEQALIKIEMVNYRNKYTKSATIQREKYTKLKRLPLVIHEAISYQVENGTIFVLVCFALNCGRIVGISQSGFFVRA